MFAETGFQMLKLNKSHDKYKTSKWHKIIVVSSLQVLHV